MLPWGNDHLENTTKSKESRSIEKNEINLLLNESAHHANQSHLLNSLKEDDRFSILVVDSNIEMQSFLYKHLIKEFNVITCNNGKDVESIVLDKVPDAIFM